MLPCGVFPSLLPGAPPLPGIYEQASLIEPRHFAQGEGSGAILEPSDARHFHISGLLYENKKDIGSPLRFLTIRLVPGYTRAQRLGNHGYFGNRLEGSAFRCF